MYPPDSNDAVERAAIHNQIFDERESPGTPRFKHQLFAVFEMPHRELADRGCRKRSMCDSVDHESTRAANPFAAVMFKCNRIFALFDQRFVQHIEAFQHRHVGVDIVHGITDEFARCVLPVG